MWLSPLVSLCSKSPSVFLLQKHLSLDVGPKSRRSSPWDPWLHLQRPLFSKSGHIHRFWELELGHNGSLFNPLQLTTQSDPVQFTCPQAETQLLYQQNREWEEEKTYLAQFQAQEKHELHICWICIRHPTPWPQNGLLPGLVRTRRLTYFMQSQHTALSPVHLQDCTRLPQKHFAALTHDGWNRRWCLKPLICSTCRVDGMISRFLPVLTAYGFRISIQV